MRVVEVKCREGIVPVFAVKQIKVVEYDDYSLLIYDNKAAFQVDKQAPALAIIKAVQELEELAEKKWAD